MELQYPRCAGLDVHKDSVVACVRISAKKVIRTVQTFGTMTRDLLKLEEWLAQEQVTHVAMEATGVYWLPVWHILESSVELLLANPAHIKNVPGRKTDVKDAEWIAELLAHGLVESSFVPPTPIQELRHLTRDRRQFNRERAQHVLRIQKALQDANIKIDSVISDLMGMSGLAFLNAIVAGETDPESLADLASPRLKASRKQIVESLRGLITPHHRRWLKRHLEMIQAIEKVIADLDVEVAALLEPFRPQVELLTTMPGVSDLTAQVIVAEIGVDMSRFPTAGHLVSWAGLSPRNNESAGKKGSMRIGKGSQWLKAILVQAAWAAARTKESHFRMLYMRLKARRGPKKAVIAVAAEMMRSVWYMLSRSEAYKDPGDAHLDNASKEKAANRLVRKLRKLGYDVQLPIAA